MQRPPVHHGKEFGRRQTRPLTRGAGSERVRNVRVVPCVVVVGEHTRDFLKPGAIAYLGQATPQARRRLAAVLAVTGGVLFGASITPHVTANAETVSMTVAGADLSANIVGPFIDRVADVAERLQRDVVRGTAAASSAYVAQPVSRAGEALRIGVEDWVEAQVAEMKISAGMIRDGLAPAVAGLADLATKVVTVAVADMEREARLAEIDRTGVVVDIPGYKTYVDLNEHAEDVRRTMTALVDGIEKKIAQTEVSYPPAAFDISDILPDASASSSKVAARDHLALTHRAAYRGDGGLVRIGGSTIRSDVVSSITRAARITGNDPVYLAALAARESSFRERSQATTSSATGLFQFIKSTWLMAVKQFGAQLGLGSVSDEIRPDRRGGYVVANPSRKAAILAMRNDPLVSGLVVSQMERSDRRVLEQALGRRATAGERYMSHFFGIADAVRMVSLRRQNPSAPAADYFKRAASANKSLFYAKNGRKYSVLEVIGGFKNWFEGPHGGMKRYAAFAHASARVPTPAAPQTIAVKKAVPKTKIAPPLTPVAHPAPVPPASATPVEASQPVQLQPAVAKIEIDEASLPPPTIQVRTPVKRGVPASYKVGAGRISDYIDASGKLSSMATTVARSQIVSGFGSNFSRLPVKIQDHLKNAGQLDLNLLAPYAKLMPAGMREGFAKEGLTFVDAVPSSGGDLVTVPNPKYEAAKRIAAARAAAQIAASHVDVSSSVTQTAFLKTDGGVVVDHSDAVAGAIPVVPSTPFGLDRSLKSTDNLMVEKINWSPRHDTKSELVSRPPWRHMPDEEGQRSGAVVKSSWLFVRRLPMQIQNEPTSENIDVPKVAFGP